MTSIKKTSAPVKASKPKTIPQLKKAHKAYMLRTCDAQRQGHGGFQWPESGPVVCPDYNDRAVCNGGLFGMLWGNRCRWPAELEFRRALARGRH